MIEDIVYRWPTSAPVVTRTAAGRRRCRRRSRWHLEVMKQLIVPMLLVRNMEPKAAWAAAATWLFLPTITCDGAHGDQHAMPDPTTPARRSRVAWRRPPVELPEKCECS